jgi:nitrogen regulatory protein PII
MHLVKRIEIIANSFELGKIVEGLDQSEVNGYAIVRNVSGRTVRGDTTEDLDMTMLDNVYVIAFCTPEALKNVMEHIRPILNKFGGNCYITDAMEVRSLRCVASI